MVKRVLVAGEIATNSEAFKNLVTLCDKFGSRFFATQEEKDSADFLAMKLREYGLQNVQVEPYTHFGWKDGEFTELWSWERGTASLELVKPGGRYCGNICTRECKAGLPVRTSG